MLITVKSCLTRAGQPVLQWNDIKAVVFDYDGTMVDSIPYFDAFWQSVTPANYPFDKPYRYFSWPAILQSMSIPPCDVHRYARELRETIQKAPLLLPSKLAIMVPQHYILTNTPECLFRPIKHTLPAAVMTSQANGDSIAWPMKPDASMYKCLEAKIFNDLPLCRKDNILFIDDSAPNCATAVNEMGWRAWHFDAFTHPYGAYYFEIIHE